MKILIVDDHPLFLSGVEFMLKKYLNDAEITVASSGEAALGYLRRRAFDLVLLDLHLPGMTGNDLLQAMPNCALANPYVPVLCMSADIEAPVIVKAVAEGARGFVPKTHQPVDMVRAIRDVLSGETYLPPEVELLADAVDEAVEELSEARESASSQNLAQSHGITPRQLAVLELVSTGMSNKQIAAELNLTEYTIKSHMRALFNALDAGSRTACVHRAQQLGLLGGKAS